MLYLRQLTLGPMKNFIYLIGAPDSKVATVVDPCWDARAIERQLEQDGRTLGAIWLSHHHYDHIGSVPELLQRHDVPVYVQQKEHDFSEDVRFGDAVKKVGADEELTVGGLTMRCLHTPGHTPGSMCLLAQGALVSGDTVFVDHCGRCDFEGSSPEQMFDSLHRVLKALPDDTVLYPGHDYGAVPVSSLGRERKVNPYFLADTLQKFLSRRVG
ncbi:MAG: MBL fold metallo-hydrolase [Myxococcaceae bacterium]